jgi:hypothetical protein
MQTKLNLIKQEKGVSYHSHMVKWLPQSSNAEFFFHCTHIASERRNTHFGYTFEFVLGIYHLNTPFTRMVFFNRPNFITYWILLQMFWNKFSLHLMNFVQFVQSSFRTCRTFTPRNYWKKWGLGPKRELWSDCSCLPSSCSISYYISHPLHTWVGRTNSPWSRWQRWSLLLFKWQSCTVQWFVILL